MPGLLHKWLFACLIGLNFSCFLGQEIKTLQDSLPQEQKQITLFKEGLKLMDSAKYKDAIGKFKSAVKIQKDYWEAYNKMAYCKMKTGDYKSADLDLYKSQQYGPNDFETMKLIGMNYYFMKDYKMSKKYMDSAEVLLGTDIYDDAEFHLYNAKLRLEGKAYKKALESVGIALDVDHNYLDAYKLRCEIRVAAKEWHYALRDLNETMSKVPATEPDYKLYRMRAITKFELQDFKGSITDWNVYIDAFPKEEEALIYRAAAKINMNDFTGAIVDLDEAIKINPKNHVSYCYRGLAKGSNKAITEGLKDLDYSIKLKFDYAVAYVNRAALKMAAKDKYGACEDLKKADSLGNQNAPKLYENYCK